MLWYTKGEKNLLTNSIWNYTITNLRVNEWEIPEKEFLLDIAFGYKDATDIQNNLLYIFLFTSLCP